MRSRRTASRIVSRVSCHDCMSEHEHAHHAPSNNTHLRSHTFSCMRIHSRRVILLNASASCIDTTTCICYHMYLFRHVLSHIHVAVRSHSDRIRDRSREVGVRPVRYHHGRNRIFFDLVGQLSWCPLRQFRQRVGFDHHYHCESTCMLSCNLSCECAGVR